MENEWDFSFFQKKKKKKKESSWVLVIDKIPFLLKEPAGPHELPAEEALLQLVLDHVWGLLCNSEGQGCCGTFAASQHGQDAGHSPWIAPLLLPPSSRDKKPEIHFPSDFKMPLPLPSPWILYLHHLWARGTLGTIVVIHECRNERAQRRSAWHLFLFPAMRGGSLSLPFPVSHSEPYSKKTNHKMKASSWRNCSVAHACDFLAISHLQNSSHSHSSWNQDLMVDLLFNFD